MFLLKIIANRFCDLECVFKVNDSYSESRQKKEKV